MPDEVVSVAVCVRGVVWGITAPGPTGNFVKPFELLGLFVKLSVIQLGQIREIIVEH